MTSPLQSLLVASHVFGNVTFYCAGSRVVFYLPLFCTYI